MSAILTYSYYKGNISMIEIEYLKLVNFKGILDGLKRDTIEIDFTKSTKRNIFLLGANGKGKSTIMSTLTPYRETFEPRDPIVEGLDGYKEIHYRTFINNEENKYIIKHHYFAKKGNKSFISKFNKVENKYEELNPSGIIKGFNIKVSEELGVTPDFFKLNKLGSNSSNIIDYTNTERKVLISKFVIIEFN